MDLIELKSQWNQVLDLLLEQDRIAWLAYFDARLVSLDSGKLLVNFADSEKFGGDHNYKSVRKPEHTAKLVSAILKVTGINIEVVE
ncbi:MAG: hypothetical protein NTZ31_01435 [Actinobacteria bacterium]|jgi:hypothetical protein|nr:hypothetical protein [Actinomycetota bacterium]